MFFPLAHGGEAYLLVLLVQAILVVAALALAVVLLAAIDIVSGVVLLLALRKKRLLFIVLPLLNLGVWFAAAPRGWAAEKLGEGIVTGIDWLMFPLSAVIALCCAAVIAPLQLLARRTDDTADETMTTPAEMPLTGETLSTDVAAATARPRSTGERCAAFGEGFRTPWDGLAYMCRHPGLWKYGIIPIILNVIITGLVIVLLIVVVGFTVDWLHPKFPEGGGWLALEIVCGIGLLLLALVGAFVCWLLLQKILCDHFYGKLAVQVELGLGLPPEEIHDVPFLSQLSDAIRDVFSLVFINVGLLLLHVVPVLGSLVAAACSFYFAFLILGGDFLSYPLDIRGMRRSEKRAFCKRHRFHTLGLGAVVTPLLFVPVVGAVLLTTAVTGSVLLHRRLTSNNGQT